MKIKTLLLILVLSSGLCLGATVYPGPSGGFVFYSGAWYAPDKDPSGVLDYTMDWELWLDTDQITVSSWSASTGITVAASGSTSTTATVWLSGGTVGKTYQVTNTITTSMGRTTAQSFYIRVKKL